MTLLNSVTTALPLAGVSNGGMTLLNLITTALPLAGVVPFPRCPLPYLASAPHLTAEPFERVALFHKPAFGRPLADVGVVATVQPADGDGVLECEAVARVRRRADGGYDLVVDDPLSGADLARAGLVHLEIWRLMASLDPNAATGQEEDERTLASLRPGLAPPSDFSLALASVCELDIEEQQRMLETVCTLERLAFLEEVVQEAAGMNAARAALAQLQAMW